jgi:hypothetical protein
MGAGALATSDASPALAEIIGGRRLWTVSMICPCRPSALAALAMADQQRAAGGVEVWLGEAHRLADAKAGPPEHGDQCAQAEPVV